MMDQPFRNMQRKIVNVKKENKCVSSWKRNKEFINDARSAKYKDLYFTVEYQYEYVHIYLFIRPMNLSIYLNLYAFNISKQICNYLAIEYLHVLNLLIIKTIYVV